MPVRPCLNAGCPDPATYRGRCQRHARQRERQINRAGKSVYSTKRWRMTRRRVLSKHPLCKCGDIATDVHHKVDIADGGNPWSMDNLEALCHSCHSQLTRQGQGEGPNP